MGHRKPMVVAIAAVTLGLVLPGLASAAGYALNEQSAHASGTANAGAAANVENASILYFNPAGMSRLPQGTQISFGAAVLNVDPKAKDITATNSLGLPVEGSNGGDFIDTAVIPNFYVTHTMGDFAAGLGVYVPFGLTSDYDNNFKGRFLADETEIQVISISPSFAFNITEQLSLGASLNIMYGEGKLTRAQDFTGVGAQVAAGIDAARQSYNLPALTEAERMAIIGQTTQEGYFDTEGDDWEIGWTIGLMYQPLESTTLGLTYRSKTDFNLTGDTKLSKYPVPTPDVMNGTASFNLVNLKEDAEVPLTTPESVTFALKHDFNDQWTLLAGATWTRWSRFQNLDIYSREGANGPVSSIGSTKYEDPNGDLIGHVEENFHNTWSFAVGALYHLNENWTLKAGYAYDESAVSNTYLTARVPSSDRQWLTLGAQWRDLESGWTVDAAFGYLIIDDVKVNEFERSVDDQILLLPDGRGTNYQAKYEIDAWGAGIQVSKRF